MSRIIMKSVKGQLDSLRQELLELHRELLNDLKRIHEWDTGQSLNATAWFQTLVGDPRYQWVMPLNSLIADADALSERANISDQDLGIIRTELEKFFFKDNEDVTSFNSHYRKLIAHNPELTSAHGQIKLIYLDLPNEPVPANTDEIRKGWHKIGASKRKLLN